MQKKMIDLFTQYPIITNKHVYTCIVAISGILFSNSTSFIFQLYYLRTIWSNFVYTTTSIHCTCLPSVSDLSNGQINHKLNMAGFFFLRSKNYRSDSLYLNGYLRRDCTTFSRCSSYCIVKLAETLYKSALRTYFLHCFVPTRVNQ